MKHRYSRWALLLILIFPGQRAISQPVIDGFNVYYGDLHNHCIVSDGTGTPADAYAYARDVAQYDFFGLADHSNLISSSEWTLTKNTANTFNVDNVFTAFYGFEWTTYLSYGHVTVVNTDDYCSNSSPTNTFTGLVNWLNTRDCIAFFNHPGWEFYTMNEFNHFATTPSSRFVGIELFNTLDGFEKYYYNDGYYSSDGNKGYYDEALVRHWKIGAMGGDDNHSSTWGTATQFRTGVLATAKTRAAILNAYKAKRIFSTEDKSLAVSMKINGYDMGSTIQGGTWNVVIKAFDAQNEVISNVYLIKNGTVIYTWAPNTTQPSLVKTVSLVDGDYIYARVKEADGDEAITSPVFISGMAQQPPQVTITAPSAGTVFFTGDQVGIAANAVDPDGTITKVEFYTNGQLIGEDLTSPFSLTWTPQLPGNYLLKARATDNSGLTANSNSVVVSVNQQMVPQVITSLIRFGSDDAEELSWGEMILDNPEIRLVYNDVAVANQTVGLLFRDIHLSKEAVIEKALLQFTSAGLAEGASWLTITGEASSFPATYSGSLFDISSRAMTSASVSWNPGVWKDPGLSGADQQTPDLSPVIREVLKGSDSAIVERLNFIISGEGLRRAVAYEAIPDWSARLIINCLVPAGTQPATGQTPHPGSGFRAAIPGTVLIPNPSDGEVKIRFAPCMIVKDVKVYSSSGFLLDEYSAGSNSSEMVLPARLYSAGLYFVRISYSDRTEVVRMIRK